MLFLNDPGPSIREALNIFSSFTVVSKLKVNWGKFQPFPIDPTAGQAADSSLPLSWALSIHYLGINITPNGTDFIDLNLTTLFFENLNPNYVLGTICLHLL